MFSAVLTGFNIGFFNFLNVRMDWETEGLKKMILGIVGSIFVTVVGILLCRIVSYIFILNHGDLQDFFQDEKVTNYIFGILFSTIVSLFFHAFAFYKALQESKVQEQKIIAGTASAKYDALKNQLDPHFLFNSLNVLTSLIGENPEMAEKFTTSLSKVYRYVLEQKNKNLILLTDELHFAKTYVSLLQMRFENSIFLEVPAAISAKNAKIIPLSLQILLENTVKHNVVSAERPLYIRIYEKENYLIVENNLQLKEVLDTSSGIGLLNIKERYQQLTNREFEVQKTKLKFMAKLPILTKQLTVTVPLEASSDVEKNRQYIRYRSAKERVEEIKAFYINLTAYSVVTISLAIFNFITNPNFLWFIFGATGWGIGIIIHWSITFSNVLPLGKSWKEKRINKLMQQSTNN